MLVSTDGQRGVDIAAAPLHVRGVDVADAPLHVRSVDVAVALLRVIRDAATSGKAENQKAMFDTMPKSPQRRGRGRRLPRQRVRNDAATPLVE